MERWDVGDPDGLEEKSECEQRCDEREADCEDRCYGREPVDR